MIWFLIVLMNTLRFVGLDSSPPGFYIDEASNAAHLICMSRHGEDANGVKWPLFSAQFESGRQEVAKAGEVPPVHLYFGSVWVSLFGGGVYSIRAISAFLSLLTTIGIFLLARLLSGNQVALWAALTASISPWLFQLGRFSGMAPFQPVCVVFAVYLFLKARNLRGAILAGLIFGLSFYSYPPARVQMILLFPALCYLKWRRTGLSKSFLFVFSATNLSALLPLLFYMRSKGAMLRVNEIAIFGSRYISDYPGQWVPWVVLRGFLKQLLLYFEPSYLFLSGDIIARHSIQWVGQLSWLDLIGVIGFIILMVYRKKDKYSQVELMCLWGYFAGLVPAALTQGTAHALRSAGSIPFLCIWTGLNLYRIGLQLPKMHRFFHLTAVSFSAFFLFHLFSSYPSQVRDWWHAPLHEKAEQAIREENWYSFAAAMHTYPAVAARYYLVRDKVKSCHDSRAFMDQIRIKDGIFIANVYSSNP